MAQAAKQGKAEAAVLLDERPSWQKDGHVADVVADQKPVLPLLRPVKLRMRMMRSASRKRRKRRLTGERRCSD